MISNDDPRLLSSPAGWDWQVSLHVGILIAGGSTPALRHRVPREKAQLITCSQMEEQKQSFVPGVSEDDWKCVVAQIERNGRKTEGRRWEQKKRKGRHTEYRFPNQELWVEAGDGSFTRKRQLLRSSCFLSLPHLPYDVEVEVSTWDLQNGVAEGSCNCAAFGAHEFRHQDVPFIFA